MAHGIYTFHLIDTATIPLDPNAIRQLSCRAAVHGFAQRMRCHYTRTKPASAFGTDAQFVLGEPCNNTPDSSSWHVQESARHVQTLQSTPREKPQQTQIAKRVTGA